jgi:vancomycin resistance protein YoaR
VTKGAELLLADPETVFQKALSALEKHDDVADCVTKTDSEADAKDLDLQQLHDQICGDPVNAYFDTEAMEIVEARSGVQFDVAQAQKLWDTAGAGDVVEIPCTVTPAAFHKDDVPSLYGDLLAIKSTSLGGSSWNRVNNVTLAAGKIHDVILYPGQSFSYNDTVGQRTWDAGFREAAAYANGEVVQELGGGICQVSSTLYWCAMTANLKILERTNHMFSVGYIEPGMDATVSWGSPDFRFENNRTFPIAIVAYVSDGMLTVQIWGTDVDGTTARIDYAMSGMTAVTYRHVFDALGNELSCEVEAVSTYHSHNE